MVGARKKFYRVQHAEIYLLDLKVQYKHKMKLSLAMVGKHIFLYLCLPDYNDYKYFFQITTHSRLLSQANSRAIASAAEFTGSQSRCISLQEFHTEQQFVKALE